MLARRAGPECTGVGDSKKPLGLVVRKTEVRKAEAAETAAMGAAGSGRRPLRSPLVDLVRQIRS